MSPSDPPVAAPTPNNSEAPRRYVQDALEGRPVGTVVGNSYQVAAPTPETPSHFTLGPKAVEEIRLAIVACHRFLSDNSGDNKLIHRCVAALKLAFDATMPDEDAPPLAGAVSHPQPEQRTTKDDEVARGDRRGLSAGFGTAGSDAGHQGDRIETKITKDNWREFFEGSIEQDMENAVSAEYAADEQSERHETRSPDGDGQEESGIGTAERVGPKGVSIGNAGSAYELTTRDGDRAERTRPLGTNADQSRRPDANDAAGSEPAESQPLAHPVVSPRTET